MENKTFTRITLTRATDTEDRNRAINAGSYPSFVVNLATSIQGVTVGDLSEAIERTEAAAVTAVSAAEESKNSAAAAKTSETNAATAATGAKGSETKAKASETAAKTSETNAKTSETNAKSSESAAATSQTAAKGSETKAKASETAAKTSETNAKTSETNAKSSETNSKSHEDVAADSAAKAKLSETNAKTSETNAKSSEDKAKASEIAAEGSAGEASTAGAASAESAAAAKGSETKALAAEEYVSNTKAEIDIIALDVENAKDTAVSSAQAAELSANNAKASETASASSASAAAQSAVNADSSAVLAQQIVDSIQTSLDGKLDKTGGTITKNGGALALRNTSENQALFMGFQKSDGTRRGYVGSPDDKNGISLVNDIAGTALTLTEDKRLTFQGKDVATFSSEQVLDSSSTTQYATPMWVASKENSAAGWVKVATVGTGSGDSKNSRYLFTFNCTTPSFTSRGSFPAFGMLSLTIGNASNVSRNFEATYTCSDHFGISNTEARIKIKQLSEYKAEIWVVIGAYSRLHCSCITMDALVPHSGVFSDVIGDMESGNTSTYGIAHTYLFATADKNGNVQSKESLKVSSTGNFPNITLAKGDGSLVSLEANPSTSSNFLNFVHRTSGSSVVVGVPNKSGSLVQVGDFGLGSRIGQPIPANDYNNIISSGFYAGIGASAGLNIPTRTSKGDPRYGAAFCAMRNSAEGFMLVGQNNELMYRSFASGTWSSEYKSLMMAGDNGWGGHGEGTAANTDPSGVIETFKTRESRIWRTEIGGSDYVYRYAPNLMYKAGDTFTNISTDIYTAVTKITTGISANPASYKPNTLWGTSNTTVDSAGNIKKASPVVQLFNDKVVCNDESEGVTTERLGKGKYLIKGVLGLNSDAAWGGINGGVVIPKGINDLNLFWLDFKVQADGNILIETTYRKHLDLPSRITKKRLEVYPEFVDENGNELESDTPCDIPEGYWVDIRVQMPDDSIFNIRKQAMEQSIKEEISRREREDALSSIVQEQNKWMGNTIKELEK